MQTAMGDLEVNQFSMIRASSLRPRPDCWLLALIFAAFFFDYFSPHQHFLESGFTFVFEVVLFFFLRYCRTSRTSSLSSPMSSPKKA